MTDQEINEAVAVKLGYKLIHFDDSTARPFTEIYRDGKENERLRDYSHSLAAAWEIVEHMSKNSWIMMLEQHGLGLPHYAVRFSKIPYSDEMTSHASADTAPMAICLAFLKLP